MPFTPFHLGPALFLGSLLSKFLNFPALAVASVIVDLEPLFVLLLGLDSPLHGFFHSFLGGSIAAIAVALAMQGISGPVAKWTKLPGLGQETSLKKTAVASFLGVYSHVVLDALLYNEMRPFYPLDMNPFFLQSSSADMYVYSLCVLLFLAGLALYCIRMTWRAGRRDHPAEHQ